MPRILAQAAVWWMASAAVASAGDNRDWSAYLGDPGATHFSELDQIDRENVAQLRPAWIYHSGGIDPEDRSQIQCNPLVIDGVLYGVSANLVLFALDATNGRERWRFEPARDGVPWVGTGFTRGLAWWSEGGERRLLFGASHYLYAIDPATGQPYPDFGDNGRIDLLHGLGRDTTGLYYIATTPGAVFRDLVIIGGRVSEGPGPAAPGHVRAFDVRTGEQRWIFHTIPRPGEVGYETWPPDVWRTAGGVNCWAGLTVDRERGIVFVPTGSAAFDFWGGNRVGKNLFANCLIALDAATGRRRWHFQFVHHDLWDRDLPAPPVLCEVRRGDRRIAAVAQVTKSGHVWVFDRETGESLFPWQEVPVPASDLPGEQAWPTQPLPDRPAPFARQVFDEDEITNRTAEAHAAVRARWQAVRPHRVFDPPSERGTIIFPGFDGGAEWGGPAVDPDGVLYVNSNEMAWILTMVRTARIGPRSTPTALYRHLCMSCHGENREGNEAQDIPRLTDVGTRYSVEEIEALLTSGKGMMPAFGFLDDAQRHALATWLTSPEDARAGEIGVEPAGFASSPDAAPWATTGYNRFLDAEGYPAVKPPWGTLSAIDLNTGEYRWKIPLGDSGLETTDGRPTGLENYGGPLVTAGGLLFIGATKDEKFRAFDVRTGAQLWETQLPAGGYAAPATYLVDGRQFVVIACGGGKMQTKSGDAYVAFVLP